LDLSKCSVLHVEDFKAYGFDPADKFIFIIGHEDAANVLAFLISSQVKYAKHPYLAREQVHVPKGTIPPLTKESWIQCFHQVHRLGIFELQSGFEKYTIQHRGHLPTEFLKKVRNVVECSDVLRSFEIQDCLDAIDKDKSSLK
jgi:hypothetical protein